VCRFATYLGEPLLIEDVLYNPVGALVRQAVHAELMSQLNLGGFGLAAGPESRSRASIAAIRRGGVPGVLELSQGSRARSSSERERPRAVNSYGRWRMVFQVGQRVAEQARSTERPGRAGEVREVLRERPSPRYRIHWDDGHETVYTPAAGALNRVASKRRAGAQGGR
jgi:hypothetical protein